MISRHPIRVMPYYQEQSPCDRVGHANRYRGGKLRGARLNRPLSVFQLGAGLVTENFSCFLAEFVANQFGRDLTRPS
jgi:hypothetical protein